MVYTYIRCGVFSVLVFFYACNDSGKTKKPVPDGMFPVALTQFGKPISIWVPDTSATHFNIEETSDGALNIRSGPDFGISIYEQATDLVLKKNDITNDEVNRLTSFIVDSPSALMWESAITTPETHFVLNKSIGGREFSFQDIHGSSFSAAGIKTMFDSANEATEVKGE